MFLVLASVAALIGQIPDAKASALTPQEARALKIAIKNIDTSDGSPSEESLQTLFRLGPKAADAVPQLVKLFEKTSSVSNDENSRAKREPSRLAMNVAKVLGMIGPGAADAYPALMKAFDSRTTPITSERHKSLSAQLPLRSRLAVPLAQIASGPEREKLAEHFGEALKVRSRVEVESILEGVAALGPAGAPAIPGIVERMKREEKRYDFDRDGCQTLAAIGSAAVPALIEHYKWTVANKHSPTYVIDTFIAMGPRAKAAVPVLVDDGLLDSNPAIRAQAAEALGQIASGDEKALTGLMEAAQADTSERVKEKAIAALIFTGRPAIPTLARMFRDDPHNPGYPLVFSFFGPAAKAATLPLVMKSISDPDERVRLNSVLALRSFGDSSPEIITALHNVAIKDASPKASAAAMAAIRDLQTSSKAAPRRR